MKSAMIPAALLLLAAPAARAQTGDHAAEIAAFARIMADIRTAAERCTGLSPDWTIVNAEKERLRIADVDYFAFRKQAAERADGTERMLGDKDVLATWCADAATRYGPQGSALPGALRR